MRGRFAVVVVLGAVHLACGGASSTPVPKRTAAPVVVAPVVVKSVPVEIRVIGNAEAFASIPVKSRIGGELVKVYFQEGDFVKAGETIFEIDPRPYQSAVNRGEAAVARDTAALEQAEANLARDTAQQEYLKAQASRYQKLFQEGVVSRDQHEQAVAQADSYGATLRADQAAIASARETIRADKGALESARLDLSFCTIRSPIHGRTGSLAIKQGTIVKANDVDLVTINQVEPIYVSFAAAESELSAIRERLAGRKLMVRASPQDGSGKTETGELTFVDNTVDMATGTIKLKATFPNTSHTFWPGQFVDVSIELDSVSDAKVVPTQAVQTSQQGQFVYVVKSDNTIELRNVQVAVRGQTETALRTGVAAGEQVVTEGHLRLAPGMEVAIQSKSASTEGGAR